MKSKLLILGVLVAAVAGMVALQKTGRGFYSQSGDPEMDKIAADMVRYGAYTWSSDRSRPRNPGSKNLPYQNIPEVKGNYSDRNMEHRYGVMQFPESFEGKTVLDLGCNLGRICLDAANRGATRVVGVDFSPGMMETAEKYAKWRAKKYGEPTDKIEFYTADLNKGVDKLKSIIGDQKFDYVFGLSIWGVVDHDTFFDIINHYASDAVWFEGHNIEGNQNKYGDQSKEYIEVTLNQELKKAEKVEFLGYTSDDKRRRRANFKVSLRG